MFSLARMTLAGALSASVAAAPVSALPRIRTDDWDLGRNDQFVVAAVTFENFGVAVRCRNGVLGVVASGLRLPEGEQTVSYSMGDQPARDTTWVGAPGGSAAFAIWPASIANDLRRGGRLTLGVKSGERIRRVVVDIPPSPAAIGQVFSACERSLPVDAADAPPAENLGTLVWRHSPDPVFPDRTASASGIAALNCSVLASGGLRRCRVESEFPEGGGFGRAAAVGAHRSGRVGLPEGQAGALEGRQIAFVVRYRLMDENLTPRVPTRLP